MLIGASQDAFDHSDVLASTLPFRNGALVAALMFRGFSIQKPRWQIEKLLSAATRWKAPLSMAVTGKKSAASSA
jgi:hypothetical protein